MASTINEARRFQTLMEIRRLRDEFNLWHKTRTGYDLHEDGSPRGQHESQLAAIKSEVLGAAAIIDTHLQNLDVGASTPSVYERCASIERQVVWLWRIWQFFRDKFDQRDNEFYAGVLRAADEVVWSCFSPFFQHPQTKQLVEPPPLAYVEADDSPSALRRDQKQSVQRRGAGFVLVQRAFEHLPVSILKISIMSVGSPWSLVLIGHETGHFIQPKMSGPEGPFADTFAQHLADAVASSRTIEAAVDAEQWTAWAPEVFADWYAVVTMGQWALWSLAQFELAETAAMAQRRADYPAPIVRLALIAELAEHYGLPGHEVLAALRLSPQGVASNGAAARDLAALKVVVPAIVASVPKYLPQMEQLVGFNADDYRPSRPATAAGSGAAVDQWTDYLLKKRSAPASNRRNSARLVAAAAAQAWSRAIFRAGGDPEELRTRSLTAIRKAAMPGVRSVNTVTRATEERKDAGQRLADIVARADDIIEEEAGRRLPPR